MNQPFFPPVSFSSKNPQVYTKFKQTQGFTLKAIFFIWSYNNIGNNDNLDHLLGVSGTTREYIGKFMKLKQIPLTTIFNKLYKFTSFAYKVVFKTASTYLP